MSVTERIEELFAAKYAEGDEFLVNVDHLPSNKICVFVDSDNGLSIKKCAEISRYLEFYLDHEDIVADNYNLEVSSPGVGKPLLHPRQFSKNIGRKVAVILLDGGKHEGKLIGFEDDKVTIEWKERKKLEGASKKTTQVLQHTFPLTDIKETKVLVTF